MKPLPDHLPPPWKGQLQRIAARTPCRCAECDPGRRERRRPDEAKTSPADLAAINDRTPAPMLGLTMSQAVKTYRRPFSEVRQAFLWGAGDQGARLGRPDHWGVFWAPATELKAVFGPPTPQASVMAPASAQRVHAKIAVLEAAVTDARDLALGLNEAQGRWEAA